MSENYESNGPDNSESSVNRVRIESIRFIIDKSTNLTFVFVQVDVF